MLPPLSRSFTLAAALAMAGAAHAAPEAAAPAVADIIAKSNHAAYYQGESGKAKVEMTITDKNGAERTRSFTILRRDEDASAAGDAQEDTDQNFYVHFRAPADVRNTVFMVHKRAALGEEDDRWLYLPALDLVKRIAAGDKRTSFVGSHFFYEDVSGRSPAADTHELVSTDSTYYVLKSTPKNPENVAFSHYTSWVHKKTFLPIRVEYTDKNGTVYRRAEVLEVQTIDGHPTVTKAKMSDLASGGHTTMRYTDVTYNVEMPENLFTERYLRTPPRRVLR